MSRVGKVPIEIPEGVEVQINQSEVQVKGKLGKLVHRFSSEVTVQKTENKILVAPDLKFKNARAMWGLTRNLINNMVIGVSKGFEKKLEIFGVGYKADVTGNFLTLNLGYSHEIKFQIPEGVTIKAEKPTLLSVFGYDKQKVGQVAAIIVKQRPPEPYKGKGV
jgi:large subunit ribosomal protein L6